MLGSLHRCINPSSVIYRASPYQALMGAMLRLAPDMSLAQANAHLAALLRCPEHVPRPLLVAILDRISHARCPPSKPSTDPAASSSSAAAAAATEEAAVAEVLQSVRVLATVARQYVRPNQTLL